MKPFRYLSAVEQLAGHLREEIVRGEFGGELPGVGSLAAELGCSPRTVLDALSQLESEGFLRKQGAGRRSRVTLPKGYAGPDLKVAILLYKKDTLTDTTVTELLGRLLAAGHRAFFTSKSLHDLRMDPERVGRFVKNVEADAWIIISGSRTILSWFSEQNIPAFALFGVRAGLPIAGIGPDLVTTDRAVVRRLVELGHRRIVSLSNLARADQSPTRVEQAFLDELTLHGLPASPSYNLPKWKSGAAGFHRCLDSLFATTPPTALVAEVSHYFIAAHQYCLERGRRVPQDVSLVCREPIPDREICLPETSHVYWDYRKLLNRIVRWADKVEQGKDDRRQTHIKAEFIEGGTIGPAPSV
jgi:DNA-binding LacI/PurR family transcriptional regulator/DNA-binding transcriptional regulator YhcF (GntR family)